MATTIIQDNIFDSILASLTCNTIVTTSTFPHTLARCLPGRTGSLQGWERS